MLGGELGQQAGVERLGEARVGDGDVEPVLGQQVGGAERLADAGAVADDRHALALAQDLPGADLEHGRLARDLDADRLAARVADRGRAVGPQRGVQHVDEHRLVARRHQRDVGQRPQVGDVEGAVVRRTVVADQAGAVHRRRSR